MGGKDEILRIISENSLICFLSDLRLLLISAKKNTPQNIVYINLSSFYFYFDLAYPDMCNAIKELMAIIDPYIPLIISQSNLDEILIAREMGDLARMICLQDNYKTRSEYVFINSIMQANESDWEAIIEICKRIRELRENSLFTV